MEQTLSKFGLAAPNPVPLGHRPLLAVQWLGGSHSHGGHSPVLPQRLRREAFHGPFELNIGVRASVVWWGLMPSGMLRHPLFLRWSWIPADETLGSGTGTPPPSVMQAYAVKAVCPSLCRDLALRLS